MSSQVSESQVPVSSQEVELVDQAGVVMVSSREVAEKFGKNHCDVLRAIDAKLLSLDADFSRRNFAACSYVAGNGRSEREILMTRDGFTFIVMGFTGSEADTWKIKFIQAFNAMESKLKEIAANPFALMAGMTSEQVALFLESVKAKEKAQAETARALELAKHHEHQTAMAVNLALGAASEVALITAKDSLWFSWTHGLKMLGLKPKLALAHLREKGYLNLNNAASSRLLSAAVEVSRLVTVTPENGPARTQSKTCAAGMLWVAKHIKFPEECKERHCRLDWSEETLTAYFHDTLTNTIEGV